MSDWAMFVDYIPWFLDCGAVAEVSAPRKFSGLSREIATLFPQFSRLLAQATVTEVSVNDARYELLAWNSMEEARCGWLCLPPLENASPNVHEDHRKLLAVFGGIVERFNEPEDTWLLNLNDALTQREASHDGSFIQAYRWMFDDAGLTLPIEPTEYYSIAREASGNTTFCHRSSGQVLMFAPDHCFDHLTILKGCPEYSLYTIDGAATFRDWVESVAARWLANTESSK